VLSIPVRLPGFRRVIKPEWAKRGRAGPPRDVPNVDIGVPTPPNVTKGSYVDLFVTPGFTAIAIATKSHPCARRQLNARSRTPPFPPCQATPCKFATPGDTPARPDAPRSTRGVRGQLQTSFSLRIWKARTMSVTPDISAQIPAKTSSVYCFSMKN
jgi:hypothetical protein